ncbi:MAG: hypothetical protein GIW95_08230 [Candidatus Eremiobacteraeota bacterium]|nr:hypothetical protein [Candidatus Eremiobacteraeota bacterium]
MKRFFQLLTVGWKPKTPFDVVTAAAVAFIIAPALFIGVFVPSIWHFGSRDTGMALNVMMTMMGFAQLSIALTGLMTWRSMDRAKQRLTVMWLALGAMMFSYITAIWGDSQSPEFHFWIIVRLAIAVIGFASIVIGLLTMRTPRAPSS